MGHKKGKRPEGNFRPFFNFKIQILPIEALIVFSPVVLVPFLVGMASAYYSARRAANYDTGAHGMFSADKGANDAAGHGAADQTANDLRSTSLVVCVIASHLPAIALAGRIGLGGQGARRHDSDKGGGEHFASVHGFIFLSWTQEPPPAVNGV
jgi:hypothetical protein